MKYIGVTLITVGSVFLLGTAGASDRNLITFGETIIQALISLSAIGSGILLIRVANQIKIIKNRKARRR